MWNAIKGWFITPTTDEVLGGLCKTCDKLAEVERVHGNSADKKDTKATQLAEQAQAHRDERNKASAAHARINKLVYGE